MMQQSHAQTTTQQSLKTLAKVILGKLENKKFIEFNPKDRALLHDDLFKRLSRKVLTEEDLTIMVREQVERNAEEIAEKNFTETEAFQSQKRALRNKFGENAIQGFYLQDTLRSVGSDVCKFLFESRFVEDVFESDEVIQRTVMDTIQAFDETQIA